MEIISTREEIVHFSQMIKGNESEDIGIKHVKVFTVQCSGFASKQTFASSEYIHDGIIRDVVKIDNRYFVIGKTTSGKKEWLSVTLPSCCSVNFPPKEYELYLVYCPLLKKEEITTEPKPHHSIIKKIRVQEIKK